MKKQIVKSIFIKTLLNLFGILIIASLFKAALQPIKTDNSWLIYEKTRNVLEIKQVILWTITALIVSFVQVKRANQNGLRALRKPNLSCHTH